MVHHEVIMILPDVYDITVGVCPLHVIYGNRITNMYVAEGGGRGDVLIKEINNNNSCST